MIILEDESLIKKLKKDKLALSEKATVNVDYHENDMQNILPHRHPFLFVDCITKVNLHEKAIEAVRHIDSKDDVFLGHFPGNPIYPGVLQIEMMGQAGLCLVHFILANSVDISKNEKLTKILFTKVHHAMFINPIMPGDSVTVLAKMIEYDDYFGLVASQILRNREICSFSILEVYFDE